MVVQARVTAHLSGHQIKFATPETIEKINDGWRICSQLITIVIDQFLSQTKVGLSVKKVMATVF